MRRRTPTDRLTAVTTLTLCACIGGASPSGTAGENGGAEAGASDGDGSGDSDDDSSSSDAVEDEPQLGPCAVASSCLAATDQPITPFLEVYGPDGSCWQRFTEAQCWQDCRAIFDAPGSECAPDRPACCECSTDEECEHDERCVGGHCTSDEGCGFLDGCDGKQYYWLHEFDALCANTECHADALIECAFENLSREDACGVLELWAFEFASPISDTPDPDAPTGCGEESDAVVAAFPWCVI